MSSTLGVARCGRSASCVLCALWCEPEYGILFMFNLFCEYIQLEYERIRVIYRVHQAKYGIHILVVAPQEYVNIYSTRRIFLLASPPLSSTTS